MAAGTRELSWFEQYQAKNKAIGEQQQAEMHASELAAKKKAWETAIFGGKPGQTTRGGTMVARPVQGDDRAMKVLASLYSDPIIKAFIQAAQLTPQR